MKRSKQKNCLRWYRFPDSRQILTKIRKYANTQKIFLDNKEVSSVVKFAIYDRFYTQTIFSHFWSLSSVLVLQQLFDKLLYCTEHYSALITKYVKFYCKPRQHLIKRTCKTLLWKAVPPWFENAWSFLQNITFITKRTDLITKWVNYCKASHNTLHWRINNDNLLSKQRKVVLVVHVLHLLLQK